MNLRGRNLEPNMRGEDVRLLQDELRQLGFDTIQQSGVFDSSTFLAVQEVQRQHDLPATGIVDKRTARVINTALNARPCDAYVISGRVLQSDGEPVPRAIVTLHEKRLRSEPDIERSQTDEDGAFRIAYPVPEALPFSVILRATSADGAEIAESDVICDVSPVETATLVAAGESLRGPSEFTQIDRAVRPTLDEEGVQVEELTDDDLNLIACRVEVDRNLLNVYADAGRLSAETHIVFVLWYGLLRQGLAPWLQALLREPIAFLESRLKRAVEDNQIPGSAVDALNTFQERIRALQVEQAFSTPQAEDAASLSDLLATARISREEQEAILTRYLQHDGDTERFWERLREDGTIDAPSIERAQFSMQLGALTKNHIPLVRLLMERHTPSSTADLVRLDHRSWLDLIRGADGAGVPSGIPGALREDREENYAAVIAATVEMSFPTAFLAARLSDDAGPDFVGQADVVRFLERNPDFAFERDQVDRFFDDRGNSALEGVADAETLRRNLRAIGRLAPISGAVRRHEVVLPMMREGVTSALAVERLGSSFVARFGEALGERRATEVYEIARQRSATAMTLFASFNPMMHRAVPQAIAPASVMWHSLLPEMQGIPDWRSLFGDVDFCACEHCGSIYSPSAYLVDLLAFVRNQGALGSLTMAERRPDLVRLLLNCQNTNTPLPYIDLVNEILGNAIAPSGAATPQTNSPAEELRAQPEHDNPAANEILSASVYPWSLPFSRTVEEARGYLDHLGLPRHRLMETFRPEGEGETPAALEIAVETLGLTPLDRRIIVGEPDLPHSLQELWGLPDLSLDQLRDQLVRPRRLMSQAELPYDDLVTLLATRFVSPGADVEIDFEDGGCDLDTALIEPQPSEQRLDRIHRFERLRRRLGWSFYDLDRAISALGPSTLDDAFVMALSDVQRLRKDLDVPLDEMLVWWSALDTHDYGPQGRDTVPSIYQRIFQSPVVFDAETIEGLALDDSGSELANNGAVLDPLLPALAGALRVDVEQLQMLTVDDDVLAFSTLSSLYRSVSFARALGFTIEDLVALQALCEHDPFTSAAQAILFKNQVSAVVNAGFGVSSIDYVLRHRDRPGSPIAPSDKDLTGILRSLRIALREIRAQHVVTTDPSGALTRTSLALVLDTATLERAVELIRTGVLVPPGDAEAFIAENLPFLNTATAIDALVGTDGMPPALSPETQAGERFGLVLSTLIPHLHEALGRSAIVQVLSSEFNLSAGAVFSLLGERFLAFEAEELLDESVEISSATLPEAFAAVRALWKSAIIVSTLGLSDEEVDFLSANAAALEILDISALPQEMPPQAEWPVLFTGLYRLVDLVELHRSLPQMGFGLFQVLLDTISADPADNADTTMDAFLQRLHQLAGWDPDGLAFLAGDEGLGLTFPNDYVQGHAVRRFRDCFDALARLGLSSPNVLPSLVAAEITTEATRVIRNAAKSKFDIRQWLEVAQGINDKLRENQRDALLAHLLATQPAFESTADVFGHFLIDPEMSACQLTSRTRQAISSVQLFIQRALLSLEEGADLAPRAAEEWRWMKSYRVWEANRKIFLYPENWIEPELRKDKTPLFRDFERALVSGDATETSLGSAVSGYLSGLAAIARPEVSAIYRDQDSNTIHLFARTRELPHIYYHRFQKSGHSWTPWERIPLDIEGEHIIPAMMGRHFYLFWPVFQEKTDPPNSEDDTRKDSYELRLAWGLWQDRQWSSKRLSKAVLTLPRVHSLKSLYFRAVQRFGEPLDGGGFGGTGGGGSDPKDFSSEPRKIVVRIMPLPAQTAEWGRFELQKDGTFIAVELVSEPFEEPVPVGGLASGMAIIETNERPLVLPTSETDFFGNSVKSTLAYLTTLEKTPGQYRIVYPHQFEGFATQAAFAYEDDRATFLVQPIQLNDVLSNGFNPADLPLTFGVQHTHSITPDDVGSVFPLALNSTSPSLGIELPATPSDQLELIAFNPFVSFSASPIKKYLFQTHYHPRADDFVATVLDGGVDALLGNLSMQPRGSSTFFDNRYDPVPKHVASPHPRNGVDFSIGGAYGAYNWELFFHLPLLVADHLRREQRFEEAQRWYHYIFDPTACGTGIPPRCFWKVRPFFDYDLSNPESQPVQDMMIALSEGNVALAKQVAAWRENPFDPHAIAQLRVIAYQKTVVMKYLDNLIAWGDFLFSQNSFESVAEATQLYILATEILGPRPEKINTGEHPAARTFEEIEDSLDAFSNALVEIENQLGMNSFVSTSTFTFGGSPSTSAPPPLGTTLLFCIPENDKLLGYWDTIADRLFKIRHCMNIEGVVRDLPLFAPPIDPGLLVQATAAGVDIATAINDLSAPLPHYRFRYLLERALEFNNATKALGSALLDALDRRDGEALARIRAGHEVELLKQVREVKERQIDEAREQVEALRRSWDTVDERRLHYSAIPDRITEEAEQLSSQEAAEQAQGKAFDHDLVSADAARFIPDLSVGFSGAGPHATVSLGRANILSFFQFRGQEKSADAARSSHVSNLAAVRGTWKRRGTDWKFLTKQARSEKRQINKQISAARIRLDIAQKDFTSHIRQTEQAEEIERLMREKYTDEELQDWRVSQLSSLYFQSYQLGVDLAKRAERAFRHELGVEESTFVEFGNWDNLRKGLLSGERLELQLRRLEVAYLEQDRREFELTRHVSLASLNPIALLRLKEEGRCQFELPEALFDLDYPGHYFRRIKAVSITIPAVSGPYTTLACTLRLLRSSIRREATLLAGQYARNSESDDPRFSDSIGAVQSIATSSGNNDAGLFELNFRDERYLPFEAMGAISTWQMEIANEFRQLDYSSFTDVILRIQYTSRDGGNGLKQQVEAEFLDQLNGLVTGADPAGLYEIVSARHDFPSDFQRFLRPSIPDGPQTMTLNLTQQHFPYVFRNGSIAVDQVHVLIQTSEDIPAPDAAGTVLLLSHPGGEEMVDFSGAILIGNALQVTLDIVGGTTGPWTLTVDSAGGDLGEESGRLSEKRVRDISLVLHYTVSEI